jgi:hypothetical protein
MASKTKKDKKTSKAEKSKDKPSKKIEKKSKDKDSKKRRKSSKLKIAKEIRKQGKSTGLLVQHTSFKNLAKDYIKDHAVEKRINKEALITLQSGIEHEILQILQQANENRFFSNTNSGKRQRLVFRDVMGIILARQNLNPVFAEYIKRKKEEIITEREDYQIDKAEAKIKEKLEKREKNAQKKAEREKKKEEREKEKEKESKKKKKSKKDSDKKKRKAGEKEKKKPKKSKRSEVLI